MIDSGTPKSNPITSQQLAGLPPQMLSVVLVSFTLLIVFILRYTVKDKASESYGKHLVLEMLASAELTACGTEIRPGDALQDVVQVIFFIFAWVALLMWFDSQWTYGEKPNPCIHLEDVVEDRTTLMTAAVIVWMELGGAIMGYRFMSFLNSSLKGGEVACTNPLTVSVWEGMLYQCLGALIIRLTAYCYPKDLHDHYVMINISVVILVRLAGAKTTGAAYNPLAITGMYYFCKDMMPPMDFLAVNWVAPMAASMMAIVIGPPVRRQLRHMNLAN